MTRRAAGKGRDTPRHFANPSRCANMTGMRSIFPVAALLAALLGPTPSRAQPAARAPVVHLTYAAYVAGLEVLGLTADVAFDASGYRIAFAMRTTGLYGVLFHGDIKSAVTGRFDGGQAMPVQFTSSGLWHGEQRQTLIDYVAGQPTIRALSPPNETERALVPVAQQRDTVNSITAIAQLIETVAKTDRCDGQVRMFDGRRLSETQASTAGLVTLPPESRTIFAGPTMQCDFVGRQLGGFMHEDDPVEMARPQRGSAWMGTPVQGFVKLPVRLSFELKYFGHATMYLTAASVGP